MTTTVTVYRSSDASAPVLTGVAGSLLAVLDGCLVNGYGSQTAAGWTKPFSNSGNVGCYQNSAVSGTGFCINVNDNGPGAGGGLEARVTGFKTMSALNTGTGQFPTSAQLAIGIGALVIRKSTAASSTARNWTLIADNTVFYFFAETGDNTSPFTTYPFLFGDIFSYKTNDVNRCIMIGRNIENSNSTTQDPLSALFAASTSFLAQTMFGHYMAGNYTGVGGSIIVGKHIDHAKMGQFGANVSTSGTTGISGNSNVAIGAANSSATGSFPYPNGPDGGLYLSPIWVHHNGWVRGYLKGLWAPCHDRPLNHNDTFSGTNNMSGKSFVVQSIPAPLLSGPILFAGQVHIETSSTWS
jgi:hypothetical protein